jgi:acyl-coenzyme A thioesterase PaaI-like protein
MAEKNAQREQKEAVTVTVGDENALDTHVDINHGLCGDIQKLEKGYAEVLLSTSQDMVVDEMGLIHGGFIFGAADFAAMAAVNERNVVLASSSSQFLAPVKVGDEVLVKAHVRHTSGRKRNVEVEAFVYDIKIFTGLFKTVITEKHVLKLKLLETANVSEN